MISIKEFAEKIFENKKMMLLVVLGVLLIFSSVLFENKGGTEAEKEIEDDYTYVDEKKLAGILSEVDGAGHVSVYITYSDGGEKIIAYDRKKEGESVVGSGRNNEPYVLKTKHPEIKGVLAIAEGASDKNVKNRLVKCIKAITDLPYSNICVEIRK